MCDLHMFTLPSAGPHQAVHFIWKQPESRGHDSENLRLITNLRERKKNIYSKSSRKLVKQRLKNLGITKAYQANYILRDLIGDEASLQNESDEAKLEKVRCLVDLGEDVACDLRVNNGKAPKFEEFWEIVDDFIQEKTAVDDRRHAPAVNEGEDVVVNLAIANSYAHLYRQCVKLAENKGIDIPSYKWFLLQFWPCRNSISNMVHYTGRFKVKRMVQSRIFRKHNPDAHYTNAIQKFIMERAVENRKTFL